MADDKAPAGSSWGTLEIVLGSLLLIGLLGHLSGKKLSFDDPSAVTSPYVASTCGLTLTRPVVKEKVSGSITLTGSVGECDWRVSGRVALYAQVIDSKGKPISAYTKVPPSAVSGETVSFAITIPFTSTPSRGIGYLTLIPAVQPDSPQTLSTRIPITL